MIVYLAPDRVSAVDAGPALDQLGRIRHRATTKAPAIATVNMKPA
jgi:hypothetical protein